MPRPKSILQPIEIDEVKHAHNCQHSSEHRLQRGDKRLKLRKQRSYDYYCTSCAIEIITRDIARLQEILEELRT